MFMNSFPCHCTLIVFHYFTSMVTTMCKQHLYWKLKTCNISSFNIQTFCPHCLCSVFYIYIHYINAIVRLLHPGSGDSQGQEMFLAPPADKQTCNHDTECSNYHPSLSTLRSKGLSCSKMKWWAIYTKWWWSMMNLAMIKMARKWLSRSSIRTYPQI